MDPTLVLGAVTALDRQRDRFDDPTARPARRPGRRGPSTGLRKRRRRP